MNLQYLKYFRTLAYYEHYLKASEELNIAQSSLSHAISVLEKDLGIYLFEKHGRNVILTKHGRQYLKYVENALDILENGKQQVQNSNSAIAEYIEIGFISSVQKNLIDNIQLYKTKNPETPIQFLLYEGITNSLLLDLKTDKLDLVFASEPKQDSDKFESIPFIKQDIVVIISNNHKLAKMKHISPLVLNTIPMVIHTADSGMRKITEKIFHDCGIYPLISGEASNDRSIVSMVSLGLGAAIVTDSDDIHKKDISILTLDHKYNSRYVYLVYKKSHYIRPHLKKFIDSLIAI